MGYLGWTEEATLKTSMPAIELAYKGRQSMFRELFGTSESPEGNSPIPEGVQTRKMSPALFDALFPSSGKI
jgi:hypothetical protein